MQAWLSNDELAKMTGIVIPAFFSSKAADQTVSDLLWMTLVDCHHYVCLNNVCVVVDGDPRTAAVALRIQKQTRADRGTAFRLLVLPENRGKFWAMTQGLDKLIQEASDVQYLVIRDGDGDHLVDALPGLVRAAHHMASQVGHLKVFVAGTRCSRSRPMGWIRGELEELLDRVTVAATAFALAREGKVIDISFCLGDGTPDISSGYKVFGRQFVDEIILGQPARYACLSSNDYWHYAPETALFIEGMLKGAVFGEVQRLTWDGQPTTSFGEFKVVHLYGELLAWVYARLRIPLEVAAQLYDNCVPPMALRTTAQGSDLLAQVREHALHRLREHIGSDTDIPRAKAGLPFV